VLVLKIVDYGNIWFFYTFEYTILVSVSVSLVLISVSQDSVLRGVHTAHGTGRYRGASRLPVLPSDAERCVNAPLVSVSVSLSIV